MRFTPTTRRSRDDWIVDVYFQGLKTGRTIFKRIGVSPHQDEAGAIVCALNAINRDLLKSGRIISVDAERRHLKFPPSQNRETALQAQIVAQFVKGRA